MTETASSTSVYTATRSFIANGILRSAPGMVGIVYGRMDAAPVPGRWQRRSGRYFRLRNHFRTAAASAPMTPLISQSVALSSHEWPGIHTNQSCPGCIECIMHMYRHVVCDEFSLGCKYIPLLVVRVACALLKMVFLQELINGWTGF